MRVVDVRVSRTHPANASAHLAHIFPPNSLRKAYDIVPGTVAVDLLQLHDGSRNGLKPCVEASLDFSGKAFLGNNLVLSLLQEGCHALGHILNVGPEVVG